MVSFRFSNREISHDFNAHVYPIRKLSDNQRNTCTLYRHCKQLVEFYNYSCPGMCEGEQMETFFRLFALKALKAKQDDELSPDLFTWESPHLHPLGMVFKGLCSPLHAVRAYSTRQQFITVMKESHMLCSLQKDVIPVCEDVFEVRDYATTTFVFELGPQTNACSLARWGNCSVLVTIHRLSLYTTVRVVTNVQNTWQMKKKKRCSYKC